VQKTIDFKEKLLMLFILGYCFYYLSVSIIVCWPFTTDDAYISWTYARQLAQGMGLDWQPGARSEGYSNFLWVIINFILLKLHISLPVGCKLISLASLGVTLGGIYRISRFFVSPLLAILPVFIFSHYIGVAWWTVSGLETLFYCALAVSLIWQLFVLITKASSQDVSLTTWAGCNLFLLLLALTRFEGLIWWIPVLGVLGCQFKDTRAITKSLVIKMFAVTFVVFIAPYGLYLAWRWFYFGTLLPNSYSCKALTGSVGIVDLDFIRVLMPLVIASLPCFLLPPRDCRYWALLSPVLVYLVLLLQAESVAAYLGRLFMAPLALYSVLAMLGIQKLLLYCRINDWEMKLITCFTLLVITFTLIPGNQLSLLKHSVTEYQSRVRNRLAVVQLLNKEGSQGARVLLGDCGLIPFYARPDLRFIDSQCLNNPELVRALREKRLDVYLAKLTTERPEWIIINKPVLDAGHDVVISGLIAKGMLYHYKLIAMMHARSQAHEAPQQYYEVYRLKS